MGAPKLFGTDGSRGVAGTAPLDPPTVARIGAAIVRGLDLQRPARLIIGRDTLVGIGARLLSGCEVGSQCLIAAGAVVTEKRRIPPRSVVMGIPGKVVREVTDEDLARTHSICAHYVEMAQRYVRGAFPPPWMRSASHHQHPES